MTVTNSNFRVGPQRLWAVWLFVAVLGAGTIGYMILGLSFSEAAYQTAITVTTVGYGEVTPGDEPTAAYRWFTLALVLIGASAAVFAAGVVLESIVDRRSGALKERRMQRQISAMQGHLIICGYGRVGQAVARRAEAFGGDIVVIDVDERQLAACPYPNIVGDATNDEVLMAAGIQVADSVIATLESDASNLFLAVSARQLRSDVRVVSRANDAGNASKLRAMDLHAVVEPNEMAGARLATAALRPNTIEYLDQVFSAEVDQVELTEVEVLDGSPLIDVDLSSLETRHGVVVVARRKADADHFSSPRSIRGPICSGDVLIILGDREAIDSVQRHAEH